MPVLGMRNCTLPIVYCLFGFGFPAPAGEQLRPPVIPGFERFYTPPEADLARGGALLLSELNCSSCHLPENTQAPAVANQRQAPILDGVGSRLRAGFVRKFLRDPHAVKPGTTMPHLLGGLDGKDRADKVEALTHFLASTATPKAERSERKQIAAGRELYNKAGCAACHGSRDGQANPDKTLSTTMPLGDLAAKYTLGGLIGFLENPQHTRPSGRMPGLLNAKEARAVANYLLQSLPHQGSPENTTYAYYEGTWERLPDFTKLKPLLSGQAQAFDIGVARRMGEMALTFEGFLPIAKGGTYNFHLTSDDGSKLWIDGKLAVDNDGIHAPSTKSGSIQLTAGVHRLRAAVFNLGGGVELRVDIEGPGLSARDVGPMLMLTTQGNPKAKVVKSDEDIVIQPALVTKGRALFASLGCAGCHTLKHEGKAIASTLTAPALAKLSGQSGCLDAADKKSPRFGFSARQQAALAAALKSPPVKNKPSAADTIATTLTAFNCHACHSRDKIGGPEEDAQSFFVTTQPEMGDEGRIPPPLTGVGAKLTPAFLKHILAHGAHDRPYMLTRMPRFGEANVGHLVEAFQQTDQLEPIAKVTFTEAPAKVKAEARHMVGGQGLGCIKCHTFAGHKAEGVQGIDMTLLTARLQRDWFHHYLLDPNKFRPGTRMPAAWFGGVTPLPKVLGGDSPKQIEAIWAYLSDGTKASLPLGLNKQSIPLIPHKEAIVYRNFIQGGGTRAIAVGYPEQAHLCFDANDLRLAMLWQGPFLDAARHWTDRGAGFEPPLGDNVLHLPSGVSFAALAKPTDPWPTKPAQEQGYQFKGYRLADDQRPTFLYSLNGINIEDFPNAAAASGQPALLRTLTLTNGTETGNLVYRASAADQIEAQADGWFRINNAWRLRIEASSEPRVRDANGKKELLVPVRFDQGKARIVQTYVW